MVWAGGFELTEQGAHRGKKATGSVDPYAAPFGGIREQIRCGDREIVSDSSEVFGVFLGFDRLATRQQVNVNPQSQEGLGNVAHVHQIVAGELGFEDQGSHAMSVPRLFQEYLSCCIKSQKIASVAIAIRDSLGQESGVGRNFAHATAPIRDLHGLCRVAFIGWNSYIFESDAPVE